MNSGLIVESAVERKIYLIRGRKVMIDRDLAELYGVSTKVLNQAVKRNISRFPDDFMFILSKDETNGLRSQIVTLEKGRGKYSKYLLHAFTEHGILMLSSVLKSERAIQVNIVIMRAFIRLREMFSNHKELVIKLNELEQKFEKHDEEIKAIFDVIRQLMEPIPQESKRKIGFYND
jgi:hypothetical protein